MNVRIKAVFLVLVILQALHSVEEYTGKLWEVFAPARLMSGLASANYEKGFIIINSGFFAFGIVSWLLTVKKYIISRFFIWWWIIIELINGEGYPLVSLFRNSYVPGLISSFFILATAVYLCGLMMRERAIQSGNDAFIAG